MIFWRKKEKSDLIYDGKWLEPSNPELAKQDYPEVGEFCEIEFNYTKIENSETIRILFNPPLIHYNGFENRSEFETLALCTGSVRGVENTNGDHGMVSQKIAIEIEAVLPASDFPSLKVDDYSDDWFQRHRGGAGLTYVSKDDNWVYMSCDIQSNAGFEMVLIRNIDVFNVIYHNEYCIGVPTSVEIGSRLLSDQMSVRLANRLAEMGTEKHWYGKRL